MQPNELCHDEVIEFATLIYGGQWRDELAKNLNMTRKQLVLSLAAGDPIPDEISVPMISLIENHLDTRKSEIGVIEERLAQIRSAEMHQKQPRADRKSAF